MRSRRFVPPAEANYYKPTLTRKRVLSKVDSEMKKPNSRQYVRIPMDLIATAGVKASTIATYAAIASFADRKGSSYPSVPTIAKRAGLGESAARRECNKLVQLGFLERKAHFDASEGQRSNRYVLTWQRDDVVDIETGGLQISEAPGKESATGPAVENDTLTRSITNQRQQTILAAEIVAESWDPLGKTQREKEIIHVISTALQNGIEEIKLREALANLSQINTYVSAYSLSIALNPKPLSKLKADEERDWSKESRDL